MKWQPKLYVIIGVILACAITPFKTAASPSSPRGDGTISLYSYHTDEVLKITFRTPSGYDRNALEKIYALMRSRGDDAVHPIATDLIDLLDHIQDHFGAETVEIISGYRSPAFNDDLIANGRGAASESLHTKGMAADIHIDEITERAVWDYAKKLGAGGAGFYPRNNFVHVDVGPVRTWRQPDPTKRILTGMDLNPNPDGTALTGRNIYGRGESISFSASHQGGDPIVGMDIAYDHFSKGRWSDHHSIEKNVQSSSYTWKPGNVRYGKYRFVITLRDTKAPPIYSNEFYIKHH